MRSVNLMPGPRTSPTHLQFVQSRDSTNHPLMPWRPCCLLPILLESPQWTHNTNNMHLSNACWIQEHYCAHSKWYLHWLLPAASSQSYDEETEVLRNKLIGPSFPAVKQQSQVYLSNSEVMAKKLAFSRMFMNWFWALLQAHAPGNPYTQATLTLHCPLKVHCPTFIPKPLFTHPFP